MPSHCTYITLRSQIALKYSGSFADVKWRRSHGGRLFNEAASSQARFNAFVFPLEVMTRTRSPIGTRLREWRALNQHSETYAITLIRRQWLAMTPARLLELEAGAEPTPEEYFILDDMLP